MTRKNSKSLKVMPATVEHAESPSPLLVVSKSDSAFFDADFAVEKIRSPGTVVCQVATTTDMHARTASLPSVDSGIDMEGRNSPTLKAPPAMRRVKSGSIRNSRTDSTSSLAHSSISDQTQLLIQKMQVLEQKLKSMESQLKHEHVQRLNLEAKVVKLEEHNEKLKVSKVKAGQQLEDFAEKFFTMTDLVKSGSPFSSPFPSLLELRQESRRDSVCSTASSQSSRFSGISF